MKQRSFVVGAVAAVLVVVLWWMFVFSGMRSEASDVDDDIDAARQERSSLEAQLRQLEELEANSAETEAVLTELRDMLPQVPDLATFIEQANLLGQSAGVNWVSVSPSPPIQQGSVAVTQMSIEVEGGYFQVLEYLRQLEDLQRLVVVDGVSLAVGTATDTGGGDVPPVNLDFAPILHASLTARMFSLGVDTAPAASATTTVPPVTEQGGE